MKLLWGILIAVTVGLQYRLWVGEGSFSEVWRLETLVAEQAAANEILLERNAQLDAEVIDLKSGLEAIEERARSQMGMIARSETFYMVVNATQ